MIAVPSLARRLLRSLLLPVLLAPATLPADTPEPAQRHLLWQVSGRGGEGWLLGSLHFSRADLYPLPAVIERAWRDSGELLVEVDIDVLPLEQMRRAVVATGLYPRDQRLDQHISAEDWLRVREAAERYNLSLVLIQQQRPWLASVTLTTLELRRNGWSDELGIDRHFLALARDRKPIVELESFDGQLALFQRLAPFEEAAMLASTLDDLADGDRLFRATVDAWRRGDVAAMNELVNGSILAVPGGKRVYELLISRRNVDMAARFTERLDTGARPFMVVGAGHMVGKDGIPTLLREQGYTVTQASTPVPQSAAAQ